MSSDLAPLFEPIEINGLKLRNRFFMPAMQRGFVDDCKPTDDMIETLRQRGEGGVGLIISGGTSVDRPSGFWLDIFLQLTDDSHDVWRRKISTIQATGAKFFMQLWHPGSIRRVDPDSPHAAHDTLSPSGLIKAGETNGRAATKAELDDLLEAHVDAAVTAKALGADGVEVHAAHGYFLDQFLWSETNQRDDEYGGSTLAERARYPTAMVAAIRAAVGPDFVISFRFSQYKEAVYEAKIAEHPDDLDEFLLNLRQAGVDCFNVSARRFWLPEWPEIHPKMTFAGWVKSKTDAVVLGIGSVGLTTDVVQDLFDKQSAELQPVEADLAAVASAIAAGDYDMIGVGRLQIANANFVQLVAERRFDEIVKFQRAS